MNPAAPRSTDKRLSDAAEARIDDLQRRYPTKVATLLHVLWEIQKQERWISQEWMEYAAARCDVALSHVLGVVSFYTMFHQKPPGKHHVQVCVNITCTMLGSEKIVECLEKKLGIGHGGRTADGKISLEHVECLGGCSWAPVMQINDTYHEQLTPESAEKIVTELE